MRVRFILPLLILPLLFSCLSLTGELTVTNRQSYQLALDYSVNREYADLKYLANNRSVVLLPLTSEEWTSFVASYEGVVFLPNLFRRVEQGGRIEISARITMTSLDVLRDLFHGTSVLEGENPYTLTLSFDRGGTPSDEAVTFINGYCAGESVDFTMRGPGGAVSSGSWPLRELLLDSAAPSLSLEWEE
ncbi:MAG: hypothetical protein JXA95_07980 [Spirochaetales bacterium]|nr:hypothetical protein [Spirochaetales bacterium]